MEKIFGVDFSHWQANVNFEKLVDNDVRFAIFKAGEIPTTSKKEYTDELYKRNVSEARKYHVISGAYYYFHPSIGASRQARHFDAVMQRDGQPDLPPVIDVEDTDQREPVQVADVLKAMIDALMERGYRRPIIYSRWGFLVNQVGEPFWLKDHYLWLAQYSTELVHKPADMRNVIMWQFTDRLKLPGIGVALDGNYWLKSEEELLALVREPDIDNGPQPAPEPPIEDGGAEPLQPVPLEEEEIIPVQTPPEQPLPAPEAETGTDLPERVADQPIPQPQQPAPILADPVPAEEPEIPTEHPSTQQNADAASIGFWKMIEKLLQAVFGSVKK